MLPSLILPKKDDVDHQTMGFEMSENSMWDSIQKGSQIEVNSTTQAFFFTFFYRFASFLFEIWIIWVPFAGSKAIQEWNCQNRTLKPVPAY